MHCNTDEAIKSSTLFVSGWWCFLFQYQDNAFAQSEQRCPVSLNNFGTLSNKKTLTF